MLIKKHLPVIIVSVILVCLGMSQTILGAIYTPADRVYTGMNGYSDDYVGYVSYIKEGIYGRNFMTIRSIPATQVPTTIHLTYIIIGKISRILGLDAPAGYHASRAVLGFIYIFLVYHLFNLVLGSRKKAVLGVLLAFTVSTVGWFRQGPGGNWIYQSVSSFNFIDMAFGRVTNRPHYLLGAILFMIIITEIIKRRQVIIGKGIVLSFLGLALGTVHPTFGILLILTLLTVMTAEIVIQFNWRQKIFFLYYIPVIGGTGSGLALSYWAMKQYPLIPNIWLDFYAYQASFSLPQFWNDVLVFGPLFWFAAAGFTIIFLHKQYRQKQNLILGVWLLVQMLLFFLLYRIFKADRVRFIQSLYFVPMSYGTMVFLKFVSDRYKSSIGYLIYGLILLSTTPSFFYWWQKSNYEYTDYHEFSVFPYPTRGQRQAFAFLDTHTPQESLVLSWWEASNLILIYSHNTVLGNKQAWPAEAGLAMEAQRDRFYKNSMTAGEAHEYLLQNHVNYVYYGYQEKYQGINPSAYGFLKPVFTNSDTIIYQVL